MTSLRCCSLASLNVIKVEPIACSAFPLSVRNFLRKAFGIGEIFEDQFLAPHQTGLTGVLVEERVFEVGGGAGLATDHIVEDRADQILGALPDTMACHALFEDDLALCRVLGRGMTAGQGGNRRGYRRCR